MSDFWIVERTASTWETTALRDRLTASGAQVELVPWDTLVPRCTPMGLRRVDQPDDVPRVALVRAEVFTRNTGTDLSTVHEWLDLLELGGTRLVNGSTPRRRCRNKVTQAAILAAAGIPVPETRAVRTAAEVDACLADWGEIVLKPVHGYASIDVVQLRAGGRGAPAGSLLGMREDTVLWGLLEHYGVLCAQKFVPNRRRDLRVIVLGDTIAAAFYHVSTAPDGSVRHFLYPYEWAPVTVTGALRGIVQDAMSALCLDVGALDIVESDDGPVVIEVNSDVSSWRPAEKSPYDLTPDGITARFADVLGDLLNQTSVRHRTSAQQRPSAQHRAPRQEGGAR
ncbi:hypothetical protein OK074_7624 [Actinobacteria bacterium OK074]|nr:hypothetical protein OK074_7624 [Actinobacteria bacterium OK074]